MLSGFKVIVAAWEYAPGWAGRTAPRNKKTAGNYCWTSPQPPVASRSALLTESPSFHASMVSFLNAPHHDVLCVASCAMWRCATAT